MPFAVDRIEFFGASILNLATRGGLQTGTDFLRNFLSLMNVDVPVIGRDYADSGHDSLNYTQKLAGYLASVSGSSNVLTVVHGPGNDITDNGPYSGGASTITTNMTTVLSGIVNAGHRVMYGPISYRLPGNNQSALYNTNTIHPLAKQYSPDFYDGDIAAFNMHEFMRLRQYDYSDNVHPNDALQHHLRAYFARVIAMRSLGQKSSSVSDYVGKTVVIALNQVNSTYTEGIITAIANDSYASTETVGAFAAPILIDTQGSRLWGSYVETRNFCGFNNAGRGNAGDTSATLTNNTLLSNNAFVNVQNQAIGPSYVYIRGLPSGLYGTMSITASRNTTATDRVGVYRHNGWEKTLDAAATTPEIITFPFSVEDGEIALEFEVAAGSIFAYVSGIQLEFEGANALGGSGGGSSLIGDDLII